jgi:L-lactate dehydrogenase complex protein LldG
MTRNDVTARFTASARAVSANVLEAASLDQALDMAVQLCVDKQACQLVVSGCDAPLSDQAGDLCEAKQDKTIAAPGLDELAFDALRRRCDEQGVVCLNKGLREHLGGIDAAFTVCPAAAADTGTLLLDSSSEEVRLATMVAELHVAAVRKADIRESLADLRDELSGMIQDGPSFAACITGPSRTADIERVLALGVHGPLEMAVILLED